MNKTCLGIDIGSTTVKFVVLDEEKNLLAWRYLRSGGQPRQTLLNEIEKVSQEIDLSHITSVGLTGSGGGPTAKLIGGHHVNELIAQTRAIGEYHPHARTVIEIGGQDSKFLSVEWDEKSGKMVLVDMAMNNLCAAGTGSFLDQQADRLGISIEEDFARLALQSENPARIAGRCTVFAKSDMIHLQQKGTSRSDILAGLAMALVRNFKSVIGKGKSFTTPIIFQGGVAYNKGVARAFETVLKLKPGELIIPKYHHLMPALGTALIAKEEGKEGKDAKLRQFKGFAPLKEYLHSHKKEQKRMSVLPTEGIDFAVPLQTNTATTHTTEPKQVYLGVDVGSITTKIVLINQEAQVVARRYLPTEGKPLEVVRHALFDVGQEVGEQIQVVGVGVTGSGRYLTSEFVGGDVVRSEITAQARAAIAIDPTVDTIFEVGGQDSKYISIDHGTVVNFAMNSACAAGTGSFLEEQADKLKINIRQEFSHQAFCSKCPAALGDRCTVFMESDLVHHQQQGAKREDLTAGLAYAIVENYLSRVVESRPIGKNIFFQGGVAWNNSVVSAFSELTKRRITVPPNHDVTGAMGAAILAMEEMDKTDGSVKTKFRGFDLREQHYEAQTSICQACPNLCEVNKVIINKEKPIFYGARCDIFEEKGRGRKNNHQDIPDLFAERQQFLMGNYTAPTDKPNGKLRIGFPRTLIFYDMFPYWRAFFDMLDIEIVLSDETNPKIAALTKEHAVAETCYPAKLVYGHVVDLLNKKIDILFLPSVVNRENIAPGQTENAYCPYIPAMSHVVTAAIDIRAAGVKPLNFTLRMLSEKHKKKELSQLAKELGVSNKQIVKADEAGLSMQGDFYSQMTRRGQEVLADLNGDLETAVIVGRPYTVNDFGFCQNLPYKLRKMGVMPLPMDYLPLKTVDISNRYDNMFWRSGQDILAAATLIRDNPNLQAIYLTCFNCGPDSFIISFFRNLMDGKPTLELELDDHTADAGIITRCEAFFESLKMGKSSPSIS
jgi:predicted CoA-substrate-specific enzyme activase